MTTAGHEVFVTYEQYRAFEDSNPAKHEYLGGRIYAMAGGTPEHARLAAAVVTQLGRALAGHDSCHVYSSDLRIWIAAAELATYADAVVVCGAPELAANDPLAITNPKVVVEVTSPSTERYDRGEKLGFYMTLPSVQDVLLVSQEAPWVEHHSRNAGGWRVRQAYRHDELEVPSIRATLDLAELYR